jgi:hypothetical protein
MVSRRTVSASKGVASLVRSRIERGGERLWRLKDFPGLAFPAVAQTLSRLARSGRLERLSKGVYYHGRRTSLGASRPNPATLLQIAASRHPIFPAGVAAASLLGFTTQTPARRELATCASSLPSALVGSTARIVTRRPAAWSRLSEVDGALLDFLRRGGDFCELSPAAAIRRTLRLLEEAGRFERLAVAARTEPPRVRAMLGALGERLGDHAAAVERLRSSLNPLSRFDFGIYSDLPNASAWQAKRMRS